MMFEHSSIVMLLMTHLKIIAMHPHNNYCGGAVVAAYLVLTLEWTFVQIAFGLAGNDCGLFIRSD